MEKPKPILRISNAEIEKEFGPGPLTMDVEDQVGGRYVNVRKSNGEVVGWAKYTNMDRKVSLDHLFARKEGWHVGTSIVAAVAALEHPLPIVVQPNWDTRNYYEKMGFVEHPLEPGKLWLPDIRMLKKKFLIEKVKEGA